MKKVTSLALILCLIFSMTTGSFALDTKSKITDALNKVGTVVQDIAEKLSDIKNHWAKEFIASLTEKGIIGGYPDGTFKPDNKIKVTEFTVLVLKAKGIEIPTTEKWYQGAMDEAASEGIIKSGEFDSLDIRQINRGEMARMIVRALDEDTSSGETWFTDDNKIPSSIKGYVKKAAELGIIGGYPDGSFKHDGYATRAEASTMITKMIKIMDGETLPVQKPVEVPKSPVNYDERLLDKDYISANNFEIENGKLVFDGHTLSSTLNPKINEHTLKITEALLDDDHYVSMVYDDGEGGYVVIKYKDNKSTMRYHFLYSIEEDGIDFSSVSDAAIYLEIARMFEQDNSNGWVDPGVREKLEASIKGFSPEYGKEITKYILEKYEDRLNKGVQTYKGKTETKKFGNVTVTMHNDPDVGGGPIQFLFKFGN